MNKAFDTPVETKPENRRYDNRNHQKQEKQYKDEDISKLLLKYSARVLKTSVRMKNRSGIRIIFESLIVCVKHKFIVIPSAYNIRNWKSII